MPWFCHVYPWCTPEQFRGLDHIDYLRLKPLVDATRREAKKAAKQRG
jgi:hypothetical protein